jgi:flavin reductase (DIM6/NTAB) family NADH-FMN oxidoreductase RutF
LRLKPFMREGLMPLPVTFISTISRNGIRNIAPWSCVMPVLRPLDLICAASAKKRDTLKNIRETGEFVLNMAGVALQDKVIPTARHTAFEVDEFEDAGIESRPSQVVKPPGIAGCYAWMECALVHEYEESDYVLIVGRVLRLEAADEVLKADGSLDIEKAAPLLMTGSRKGMNFCTLKELGVSEAFSAMFPNGKDPFKKKYESQ